MSVVLSPLLPPPLRTPAPVPPAGLASGTLARMRRLTVAEYHAMIAAGILPENGRAEMIEGVVVSKPMKNAPHIFAGRALRRLLTPMLPSGRVDWSQDPITLADSEPEPDYAVVRGTEDDFRLRKPGPAEVELVIEIADSTVREDRTDSHRIYARAGIAVFWIVNIPGRQIEVYTDPQPAADPPRYTTRTDYVVGTSVPVVLDGVAVGTIAVGDVLP